MAENRLTEVAGHWLPRMEVAGLPSSLTRAVMGAAGTWENWCAAFSEEAEREAGRAAEAEAAGRTVTAGEAFARAALLYHFGQFMFFHEPDRKAEATQAKLEAYGRAAPYLDPLAEPMEVPFENGVLRAYRRRPGDEVGTVILIPGSDSTKEEFPALEANFLRRGVATVSVDGPGQGEGRAYGPLRPDITDAVAAVTAALAGPLALVGMAFGGHLALRAAGGVPGLKGIVSINGFHDLGAMWDAFPPVYRDNMLYALGADDAADAEERARRFTLARARRPRCPVLILHGGRDRIFPADEAQAQADWAGDARLEIFETGNHVCNNIPHIYRPLVADWVREALA